MICKSGACVTNIDLYKCDAPVSCGNTICGGGCGVCFLTRRVKDGEWVPMIADLRWLALVAWIVRVAFVLRVVVGRFVFLLRLICASNHMYRSCLARAKAMISREDIEREC
jgi:hypothetical protein